MNRRKFVRKLALGGSFSLLSFQWVAEKTGRNLPLHAGLELPFVSEEWRNITEIEEVVEAFPQRMEKLMEALDLSSMGLEDVQKSYNSGNLKAACEKLLEHYRNSGQVFWWRNPSVDKNQKNLEQAGEILQNIYHGFGDKGKVPRLPNGHLDWTHSGPNNDRQYTNRVNRHGHLITLMNAYLITDDLSYLQKLDLDLRDWLIASEGQPSHEGFGTSHLEPAIRIPRWARIFYGLQEKEHFNSATRLLILATIAEHAEYLLENPGHGNWVAMTQYGALTCGICWPEFKNAAEWRAGAVSRLQQNAEKTVYPDGAQKELTTHYHMVTLGNYDQAFRLMQRADREIPRPFAKTIENMWNYIAYVLRPDGNRPLNNDSDLGSETRQLKEAASRHNRPDWTYIATNGKAGSRPEGSPSRYFPWAGQMISRNGWNSNAHWSFFDVGPSGLGHRHYDFGHISINAYGHQLLIDSGRFAYQGKIALRFRRSYAQHTRGHNTILVDGQGQGDKPRIVEKPLEPGQQLRVEAEYDFARGSWKDYENIKGHMIHYRAMFYLRNQGWIIADHIETDRPRKLQPLWHFHPHCRLRTVSQNIYTANESANMSIKPLGQISWKTQIITGQDEPQPQGWYSREYGTYESAPCARYTGNVSKSSTFAWVLWPAGNKAEIPEARLEEISSGRISVGLTQKDGKQRTITIPVKEGDPEIT